MQRERLTLVDIHERLVRGVVRKHRGLEGDDARSVRKRKSRPDADPLAIGQCLRGRPGTGSERHAVGGQMQSRAEQRSDRVALLCEECRVEQPFLRLDVQIVRDVENVSHQADVDAAAADM